MSIERLRYFAAVVETRNLRKASEMVGISPPSMSKAISVLEGELNCKLIHPEGRGIGITPRGLEIYRQSVPLLEEYKSFHKSIFEPKQNSRRFRMVTFEVFSSYFVSHFLRLARELEVLMLEMIPGKMEEAIMEGIVDMGITYLPAPHTTLEYREIGSFEMKIFGREEWKNEKFENWPFAVPTSELKIHSSEIDSLDMWPKNAPPRRVKYQFELLETALQTSRLGLSVLHCPNFIVRLQNEQVKSQFQLHELPIPHKYKAPKMTKVYLVARKGSSIFDFEGKFAKFMRSLN